MQNNIKHYRTKAGYTQKSLCEKLGWKIRKLQSYEQGVRNPPVIDAIILADALNTSVYNLLISKSI